MKDSIKLRTPVEIDLDLGDDRSEMSFMSGVFDMKFFGYLIGTCFAIGLILLANSANAGTPYPSGYDQAYRSYLASLPPKLRSVPWMVFKGVASPPQPVSIDGRAISWASSCKPHDCGSNQVVVFFLDKRKAVAVYYINGSGVPHFLGGAGPRYHRCVQNLFDTGWTATRC